jgi:hypothetical protein
MTQAMGHRLARHGLKRRQWTDHVEVHTVCSAHVGARHGTTGDGRRQDGPQEASMDLSAPASHGPRCGIIVRRADDGEAELTGAVDGAGAQRR